ncbi:MAG: hypothetical protein HYW50_04285 [Candidatus Diapherotrites archaeon]|nr:hypothetical protein [Candidatus Diapherotrites archaeon]
MGSDIEQSEMAQKRQPILRLLGTFLFPLIYLFRVLFGVFGSMEKKELLKESIAKLLSLNVSDEEIILNLKDVGLSEEEAREILEETKSEQSTLRRSAFSGRQDFSKEDSVSGFVSEAKEELEEKKVEPVFSAPKEDYSKGEKDVLELWEKGIMSTINSKFVEMEKMKKEIDSVIEEKIQKKLLKETIKINSLFESQRKLGAETIKEAIDKRIREVEELIDQKIAKLNKSSELSDSWLKKLEVQRKENDRSLQELNSKIEEISKLKGRIVADANSELAELKANVEEFLDGADATRKETIQRINRSLELESKIVEGLMNEAKQKVDSLALQKSSDIEQRIQLSFEAQKKDLDKKIVELEELGKRINVEEIRKTMDEVDVFKKQFEAQIKKNVETFNSAKKELTDLIQQREALIDKQLEILKLKIKEFESFEREFAEQIGMKIDELAMAKKKTAPK